MGVSQHPTELTSSAPSPTPTSSLHSSLLDYPSCSKLTSLAPSVPPTVNPTFVPLSPLSLQMEPIHTTPLILVRSTSPPLPPSCLHTLDQTHIHQVRIWADFMSGWLDRVPELKTVCTVLHQAVLGEPFDLGSEQWSIPLQQSLKGHTLGGHVNTYWRVWRELLPDRRDLWRDVLQQKYSDAAVESFCRCKFVEIWLFLGSLGVPMAAWGSQGRLWGVPGGCPGGPWRF